MSDLERRAEEMRRGLRERLLETTEHSDPTDFVGIIRCDIEEALEVIEQLLSENRQVREEKVKLVVSVEADLKPIDILLWLHAESRWWEQGAVTRAEGMRRALATIAAEPRSISECRRVAKAALAAPSSSAQSTIASPRQDLQTGGKTMHD